MDACYVSSNSYIRGQFIKLATYIKFWPPIGNQ